MQETYQDLETKEPKLILGEWITRYNPHRKVYEGVKREHFHELFSGDKGNVLRATTYPFLEELILKTNGDKNKLEKLIKENLW